MAGAWKLFVSELATPWRSAVVGLAWCLIEFSYFGFVPYLGQEFVLTFHFDDSEFLVYSDDENRCFQYRFEYKFDIRDIKSVQVWDDIDYVDEIIFRYKKNQWNRPTNHIKSIFLLEQKIFHSRWISFSTSPSPLLESVAPKSDDGNMNEENKRLHNKFVYQVIMKLFEMPQHENQLI